MRNFHKYLFLNLFFTLLSYQCLSQVECTTDYTSSWDIYGDDQLCVIDNGNGFTLGNEQLIIWDAQGTNDPIQITNTLNSWNLNQSWRPAVDILLTAQAGDAYFQAPPSTLPSFYTGNAQAFINTNVGPVECDGALGGCLGQGIHFPVLTPVTEHKYLRPEVIAHELGHRIMNETFPHLTGFGSELEALREFTADIIGMLVEGAVTDMIDWTVVSRDYKVLSYRYDATNYSTLGKYRKATIGGHWFYLVSESGCFNDPRDLLEFLFEVLGSQDPVVCTYPTLRDAALNAARAHFGDCNECYEVIADAWNTVGLGSKYAPDIPNVVAGNAGKCNYYVEWVDQGIEGYNIKLFHFVQGSWVPYSPYEDDCIADNFANFEMLPSGSTAFPELFRVEIRPVCDVMNCTQMGTISQSLVTEHHFQIEGDESFFFDGDPNVDLFTATNCDLVVGPVPNEGLDPLICYRFEFEQIDINGSTTMVQLPPNDVILENGNMFFIFWDGQTDFFEGMGWSAQINYRCPDFFQDAGSGTITNVSELFDEFDLEVEVTNCQLRAFTDYDFMHEQSNSGFVTRVMRLTEGEYNILDADRSLLNSESCLNNYFRQANRTVISGTETQFPILDIPFDGSNNDQFFIVNMLSRGNHNNPAHPHAPNINCDSQMNSNCEIVIIPAPLDCTQQLSMGMSYCVDNSQIVLEFNPENFNIEEISHIAYRIQNPLSGNWGDCIKAINTTVIVDEYIPTQMNCPEEIVIQAVPICECNVECEDIEWTAPNVRTFPDPLQGDLVECNPPMLIGADHFPDLLRVFYTKVPGVYGYKYYTTPISSPPANPGVGRILCPSNYDGCLISDGDITIPIDQMTEYTLGTCPNTSGTGNLVSNDILDSESYLVYVQSVCCVNGATPTCSNPQNASNCVLAVEVGPACHLPSQSIMTDVLSPTSISVEWQDPDPSTYTVYALLADCNNEVFVTENMIIGTELTFEGLMPSTNYNFMISKDCSNNLCSDCVSSITSDIPVTTEDIPDPYTTPICTDNPGNIILDMTGTGWIPAMYDFQIDGTDDPIWSDNNLIFSVTDPGPHTIYIPDGNGCSPTWFINELEGYSVCGRDDICRIIDLNENELMSFWIDQIPHSIVNGVTTIEDLNISIDNTGSLIIDIDMDIIDCSFFSDFGTRIDIESNVTTSANTEFLPCNNSWRGIRIIEQGSLITENTLISNAGRGIWNMSGSIGLRTTTFQSCSEGIKLDRHLVVSQIITSIFDDCPIGLSSKSDFSIQTCTFSNFDVGVLFDNASSGDRIIGDILGSTFSGSGKSIAIENRFGTPSSSYIIGNDIDNCSIAIDFVDGVDMAFISENTINASRGILANRSDITFMGNTIVSEGYAILSSFGESYISDNVITTNGHPFFESAIRIDGDKSEISNNLIQHNATGSAIQVNSAIGYMGVLNNDLIGNSAFSTSLYLAGLTTNATTENNFIQSTTGDAIHMLNAPSHDILCNEIIASDEGLNINNGSSMSFLQGNTFTASSDLITRSFIFEPSHKGNCFLGGTAEAIGFQPFEIDQMKFDVNTDDNSCYLATNPNPPEWFEVDINGETEACDPNITIGYTPFVEDEDKVCEYLNYLNETLAEPLRRQQTIIRLIDLFRSINSADYYVENSIPECLVAFMDTTSLCGIQMIIDTEELVEDALLGSDEIRVQIQIQSTLTYLAMQQWRAYDPDAPGNSLTVKEALWTQYINELNKLKILVQERRTEEDMIWTTIDSIAIEECLDSVSMITMKAYKYMSHMDELSPEEKDDIIFYAKKCAPKYGYGVNLMRSLASLFDETDYRQYDDQCDYNNEEEGYKSIDINKRTSSQEFVIIPNPNTGQFLISNLNVKDVASIGFYDLNGRQIIKNITNFSNEIKLSDNIDSGLYMLTLKYNNGDIINKKVVITR